VIDEGGDDTSVKGAERVEQFGSYVELGKHRCRRHLNGADAR
jgi:hypothetical protein